MTPDWLHRYNHHRPHELLGRIPIVEYRVKQLPKTLLLTGPENRSGFNIVSRIVLRGNDARSKRSIQDLVGRMHAMIDLS